MSEYQEFISKETLQFMIENYGGSIRRTTDIDSIKFSAFPSIRCVKLSPVKVPDLSYGPFMQQKLQNC